MPVVSVSYTRIRAHPRTYGEYRSTYNITSIGDRLTPAYAGNTFGYCSFASLPGAHPRACGEYFVPAGGDVARTGSPPRMRGIWQRRGFFFSISGLTPAHAGNIFKVRNKSCADKAHPRACGEYYVASCSNVYPYGSPPRMRGIFLIILSFCQFVKAHPRACGEYVKEKALCRQKRGSPPCMRGISKRN